jgi:hypothetical protein
MKFIHGANFRNTSVHKDGLVDHYVCLSAAHTRGAQEEAAAKICALSELVSAMLVRMSDADVRAVAEAVGFMAVEGGV